MRTASRLLEHRLPKDLHMSETGQVQLELLQPSREFTQDFNIAFGSIDLLDVRVLETCFAS